jgi:cell division protease FtsH
VRQLAQHALDQAVSLLQPRRQLMDLLVERLIVEETIEGDAFRALVAGSPS